MQWSGNCCRAHTLIFISSRFYLEWLKHLELDLATVVVCGMDPFQAVWNYRNYKLITFQLP